MLVGGVKGLGRGMMVILMFVCLFCDSIVFFSVGFVFLFIFWVGFFEFRGWGCRGFCCVCVICFVVFVGLFCRGFVFIVCVRVCVCFDVGIIFS